MINIKLVSSEHAALVCGDHVLNVDVCVLSPMPLEEFQSLLDQVTHVVVALLVVVDFVAEVLVAVFQQVEHWKNLSVVRNKAFGYGIGGLH